MEYHGKLYGKIGNKYFDTSHTSEDYDLLISDLKESTELCSRLQLESVNKDVELSGLKQAMNDWINCHIKDRPYALVQLKKLI